MVFSRKSESPTRSSVSNHSPLISPIQGPNPRDNVNPPARDPITSDFQPRPVRRITKTNTFDGRPGTLQRIPSVQTRYMDMLLSQDTIPRLHNILASFLQWVLLAGYLVLPATFNSIRNSDQVQSSSEDGNIAATTALAAVKNLPLLYVGAFCTGIGLLGKFLLFLRHSKNYVWLVNKIFMPGLMNSSAGVISTVISIYGSHKGEKSVTAQITLYVTAGLTGLFLILFILYDLWALQRVRSRHDDELQRDLERSSSAQHEHESALEKVKRLAHEPALEPNSVI